MPKAVRNRKISIVVPCAKNRTYELKNLLPSIKAQSYRNYEVIVETEGTCGHNRNKGAKRAKGEILLFSDSDLVFSPHILRLINDTLEPGEILVYTRAGAFIAIHRNEFIPFDEAFKISEDIPWYNMMERRGMKVRYIVENRNRDSIRSVFNKSFRNAVEWQMIPEMKWHRIILSALRTIIMQAVVIMGTIYGLFLNLFRKR